MNGLAHRPRIAYAPLKSLGIDTQLVIYPGQFHRLEIPNYERDKLERCLKWWDRHLKK